MPLNSVSQYLQGQLDGLAIPGGTQTLTSFITTPTPAKLSGPLAFLGDCTLAATRETMPRGAAFQNFRWTFQVYLAYSSNPKSTNIDQQFPLIADAIMTQLRTTQIPTNIVDPETGMKSRILSVGEKFNFQKPRVRTVGPQQMLYYAARADFEVWELVKG